MSPLSAPTLPRAMLTVYVIVLLFATLSPMPGGKDALRDVDKAVHVALFAGLAVVLYWNLWIVGMRGVAVTSLLASAAVAGLIELLQEPLPYRSGDIWDFLAGVAGAAGAVLVAGLARRVRGGKW